MGYAAGDQNLYRYVGNSPTNETDPSGLCGIKVDAGAIVGVFLNPLRTYQKQGHFWVEFDPYKSSRVTGCSRIVFMQVVRGYIDGKPMKPSDFSLKPDGSKIQGYIDHIDPIATPDHWYLDGASSTSTTPWYTPDKESFWNGLIQVPSGYYEGLSSSITAVTADSPQFGTSLLWKKEGGVGIQTTRMEFYTFAFCAKGADAGKFYEGVRWEVTESWNDRTPKYKLLDGHITDPPPEMLAAYQQWLKVTKVEPGTWTPPAKNPK